MPFTLSPVKAYSAFLSHVMSIIADNSETESLAGMPLAVGKRVSNKCAVAAARQFKQVFCVDNVSLAIHEPQLTKFLVSLGIRVISCFEVKARETAWQRKNLEEPDHRTFRVCINRGDTDLLLNSDNLPSDIVISRWQFKHADKPTVIE